MKIEIPLCNGPCLKENLCDRVYFLIRYILLIDEFQSWMLGFSKFTGEWQTTEIEKDKILVEYTYSMHSDITLLYPLNWLFAKTF